MSPGLPNARQIQHERPWAVSQALSLRRSLPFFVRGLDMAPPPSKKKATLPDGLLINRAQ
jgi:hypothetical protein